MAKGPKGERRPADVNARAVMIAKIATGEVEDITTDDGKNAAAVALGRMGGKARAAGLSARKRKEKARNKPEPRPVQFIDISSILASYPPARRNRGSGNGATAPLCVGNTDFTQN